MWKRLIGLAVGIVALTSWIALIEPPIDYLRDNSVRELLIALTRIDSDVYEGNRFFGWLFIAITVVTAISIVAFVRAIIRYLEVSFANISVLESQIRLEIVDDMMSISRASRIQYFHANRGGITAYRYTSTMDSPKGEIRRKSIMVSSSIGKDPISTGAPSIWGTDRYAEVLEQYNRPLPTSVIASILPNWITSALWKIGLLDNIVVRRSAYAEYRNEHNSKIASMAVKAGGRIGKLHIIIEFPEITAPMDKHISCMLVEESIVSSVGYTRRHKRGRVILEVSIGNFDIDQELRLQWNNKRLYSLKKRLAQHK